MEKGFDKRKKIILEYLHNNPDAKVASLVELTGAAVATVRRDLLELEKQGLLMRTFGGARPVDAQSLVERTFEQRRKHASMEKMAIAAKAAELIEPGMTVMIDSGTTCWALAEQLKQKAPLRIITSALAVIESLGSTEGIEIDLVGGKFRIENLDFFGPVSIRIFQQFHADIAFLGCDGFLPEKGAFSHNAESAAISQAMIECSTKHVILCDSSKIGHAASFHIISSRDVNVLITDRPNEELNGRSFIALTPP